MSPEEQRIAIAEACGWKKNLIFPHHGHCPPNLNPFININQKFEIPDYLNDLNAMHEAEKVLTEAYWNTYRDTLDEEYSLGEIVRLTASQRAEAFLKTLGKWKD